MTEYWYPGQAISEDLETKTEDKKGIEEVTEGDKYSKYIYYYDGDWKLPEGAEDVLFQMITRFDNPVLPGSHFYWFQWIMPHDKPFMEVGHPPHIHRDHKLVFQIGTGPENPKDLGAEVEIFLGQEMERHVITKTCVLFFRPTLCTLHGGLCVLCVRGFFSRSTSGWCTPKKATTIC